MVSTGVSLFTLAGALAVFVVVGIRAHRKGDVEDFVVARNSQGAATLGLSFLAAGMGAWVLFAPPEVGAGVGLVAIVGYAVGCAAPLVAFALLGARMRAIVPAGHSLSEFVRLRFGPVFHTYVVGVSILYMLIFVTAELTAAGSVAELLSGLDGRIAAVAVAVATLAYTTYGGLRASLQTDRFQAWLILGLLVAGAAAILPRIDRPAAVIAVSGLVGITGQGLRVAATLIIAVTAANMFHQGYWQRVWAARTTATLSRGVALGVATTIPVVLAIGATGMLASGAGLALGDPPVPFFALLTGLPAWVGVGVLVLATSLVASSVDTLETGLASLVTAERPSTSLRGARAVTIALMVPAVVIALQGYSVLQLFLIADLLCTATVVPALSGLWSRATTSGALAGAVAGLIGAVAPTALAQGSLSAGLSAATFPGAVPTLGPFAGALAASAVVCVAVSLAARSQTDLVALAGRVPVLGGDPR